MVLLFSTVGISNPVTVSLTLLLIVLGTATLSRLWVATVTSVVAMLTFNFFFLPPLYAFTVADPQHWAALVVFLVVAVIASQLSSAAKERARDAVARRQEVTRLFDLSRDILLTTEKESALPALARHIARRFELDSVAVTVPTDHGWTTYEGGERHVAPDPARLDAARARLRGPLEFDAGQRAYGGHTRITTSDQRSITLVPLRLGTKPVGFLATDADSIDVGTLDALAGVAAIAIERTHFLQEREAAEAHRQRADLTSALLASLSHDLRTPLTAIRIAVTNMEDATLGDADRRAQRQLAVSEIDRLNDLFQDILDMARIDAAAITAERECVSPADIVEAAVARAGALLASRTMRIETEAEMGAEVDPRLTANALAQLLENAAKYSPPDRPIEVRGWVSQEGLHLTVRDYGPGLDPGELDHLFERFYRGKGPRAQSFGTGMGLAISRGLLAAEGGRVWGENMPGGGAQFSIVVPGAVRPVTAGTP